ncbi:MAG: hypothetical protein KDD50_00415 [Bdellovibrionales bacterium]|nr:hypothetical protein [Bdellovibrionales bacterium]
MHKLLFIFFLLYSSIGWTQEYIDEIRTGRSTESSGAAARQEIIDKVIEEVSLEYTKNYVGESKANRNITVIKNKIIGQSGKYISYIKGENLRREGSEFVMDVALRISLKDLKDILLAKGLLYQLDGPPKILLMVQFLDQVNLKSFAWWSSDEDGYLKNEMKDINSIFFEKLKDKGFYSFSPIKRKFYHSLPEVYRKEEVLPEDILFVGDYFKAQVAIHGQIKVSKSLEVDRYTVSFEAKALQTVNGRNIAKISRSFLTNRGSFQSVVSESIEKRFPEVADDFTAQLYQAWERGVFGSDLLKLSLKGNFDYNQYKTIKESLQKVNLIKAFHERSFTPSGIVFELNASANIKQIGQALINLKQNSVQYTVDSYGPKSVVVKAKVL